MYKRMIKELSLNKDVIIKEDNNLKMVFFYQEQLCDVKTFNMDYYEMLNKNEKPSDTLMGICREYKNRGLDLDIYELYQVIFMGLLVLYNKNDNKFYIMDLAIGPSRSVGDSSSEPENLFGSRDGFVENFKTNIALIRTRLKSSNLDIDEFMIGRRSKTVVNLLSINDIHNQQMREEIKKRLKSLDIDAALTMSDVASVFQDKRKIPAYIYVGSPDIAARHLLNGQFLILIDRIPTLICLPVTFSSYTKSRIDSMNVGYYSIFERTFILISLFLSTIFLGLVSSLMTFQKDNLTLVIAHTLTRTQGGSLLPIFTQILFILFLFELYSIIGQRSAKATMSSTVVLIGGLIIGQNIIDSKVVGIIIMTITALCFLSGYTITSNVNMLMYISITRFFLLVSSILFGIFGLTLGIILTLITIYKEKTFGVSFLSPFIPLEISELKGFFKPTSNLDNKLRPDFSIKDRTMKK